MKTVIKIIIIKSCHVSWCYTSKSSTKKITICDNHQQNEQVNIYKCVQCTCEETPAIDIQYICTSTCICLKKWRNDISSKNMSLIPKKQNQIHDA